MEQRTYTHPGAILLEELESRHITQKEFSKQTGIPYTMLNEILHCKRPVTSEIALIFEAALGINPELLINMQTRYNMTVAKNKPKFAGRLSLIHKACAAFL